MEITLARLKRVICAPAASAGDASLLRKSGWECMENGCKRWYLGDGVEVEGRSFTLEASGKSWAEALTAVTAVIRRASENSFLKVTGNSWGRKSLRRAQPRLDPGFSQNRCRTRSGRNLSCWNPEASCAPR